MKQMTLAAAADGAGFEKYRKHTRRDAVLAEMQTLVPVAAGGVDRAALPQARQRPPAD